MDSRHVGKLADAFSFDAPFENQRRLVAALRASQWAGAVHRRHIERELQDAFKSTRCARGCQSASSRQVWMRSAQRAASMVTRLLDGLQLSSAEYERVLRRLKVIERRLEDLSAL